VFLDVFEGELRRDADVDFELRRDDGCDVGRGLSDQPESFRAISVSCGDRVGNISFSEMMGERGLNSRNSISAVRKNCSSCKQFSVTTMTSTSIFDCDRRRRLFEFCYQQLPSH